MPLPLPPIALGRSLPFSNPDFLDKIKYDGFRSLLHIEHGRCRLVSRNGNEFKSFPVLNDATTTQIKTSSVIDGKIVCLDEDGKPQFRDLLFHRGEPRFVAFDILQCNGEDQGYLPAAGFRALVATKHTIDCLRLAIDRSPKGRTFQGEKDAKSVAKTSFQRRDRDPAEA